MKPLPVVTASVLRRACVFLMEHAPDSVKQQEASFTHFCTLGIPNEADAKLDQDWAHLRPDRVPDLLAIQGYAGQLTTLQWQDATTKRYHWENGSVRTGGERRMQVMVGSLYSSAPALDQSTIIWGVTNFLVQRAKDQLRAAVMERVAKEVCGDDRLGPLLVNSCQLIEKNVDATSTAVPGAAALRSAIRQDVHQLPAAVIGVGLSHTQPLPGAATVDAILIARYVASFLLTTLDGHDALDALAALALIPPRVSTAEPFSFGETPGAASIFAAATLLASIERDTHSQQTIWKTNQDLLALYALKATVANGIHDRPYPWPSVPTVDNACGGAPCSMLVPSYSRLLKVVGDVRSAVYAFRCKEDSLATGATCPPLNMEPATLRSDAASVETESTTSDSADEQGSPIDQYLAQGGPDRTYRIDQLQSRFAQQPPGGPTGNARVTTTAAIHATVDRAVLVMRVAIDLTGDQASFATVTTVLPLVGNAVSDVLDNDYAKATVEVVALIDSMHISQALPPNARRLITLAADISQSTDADAVDQAMERFVGASHDYRYKRADATGFYVDVNAYAGAATGQEKVCPGAACGRSTAYAAAYVPIGIEAGWGLHIPGIDKIFRSVGAFVQVVDVGSLASWRLHSADESISSAPKVGIQQIFSPGASLVLGINGWPISVGVGSSVTPNLREVATGTSQTVTRNAIHPYYAFVAVDIPLFP